MGLAALGTTQQNASRLYRPKNAPCRRMWDGQRDSRTSLSHPHRARVRCTNLCCATTAVRLRTRAPSQCARARAPDPLMISLPGWLRPRQPSLHQPTRKRNGIERSLCASDSPYGEGHDCALRAASDSMSERGGRRTDADAVKFPRHSRCATLGAAHGCGGLNLRTESYHGRNIVWHNQQPSCP